MSSEDTFVPALNQSYRFEKDRLIFEDGVSYSLNEAAMLARDASTALGDHRLTDDDIQAIHLVKKMMDGEILGSAGAAARFVHDAKSAPDDHSPPAPESPRRTLDDIAREMGEL